MFSTCAIQDIMNAIEKHKTEAIDIVEWHKILPGNLRS